MTASWPGCLPLEPSEAITVAAHTWGAVPIPRAHTSTEQCISALPILEAAVSPAQEGFRPSDHLQRVTSIEPGPQLMSGIKPTHAPAYQGKYLDQLISE